MKLEGVTAKMDERTVDMPIGPVADVTVSDTGLFVAEVTLSDSDLLRALSAKIVSQPATVVHGVHIPVGWSPQLVDFA